MGCLRPFQAKCGDAAGVDADFPNVFGHFLNVGGDFLAAAGD
jgi:hypothetical protein